jgi:hypothetical protein
MMALRDLFTNRWFVFAIVLYIGSSFSPSERNF